MESGNAGEEACQPTGQDLRCPSGLRLLRHLQHGIEVEQRAHDEQDGAGQRPRRALLLLLVGNLSRNHRRGQCSKEEELMDYISHLCD